MVILGVAVLISETKPEEGNLGHIKLIEMSVKINTAKRINFLESAFGSCKPLKKKVGIP